MYTKNGSMDRVKGEIETLRLGDTGILIRFKLLEVTQMENLTLLTQKKKRTFSPPTFHPLLMIILCLKRI